MVQNVTVPTSRARLHTKHRGRGRGLLKTDPDQMQNIEMVSTQPIKTAITSFPPQWKVPQSCSPVPPSSSPVPPANQDYNFDKQSVASSISSLDDEVRSEVGEEKTKTSPVKQWGSWCTDRGEQEYIRVENEYAEYRQPVRKSTTLEGVYQQCFTNKEEKERE